MTSLFIFEIQQRWLKAKADYRLAKRHHKGQRAALRRLQEITLTLLKAELDEKPQRRAA